MLKPLLDELGLVGYPKTSGGRGVHVFLRIKTDWDFIEVRRAGIALAREVERRAPDAVTTSWWKEERGERLFIDYNQNARDRTFASAYSAPQDPDRDGVDAVVLDRAAHGQSRRLHHRHCAGFPCRTALIHGRTSTTTRAVPAAAAPTWWPPMRSAASGICRTRRAIRRCRGEPPRVQPSKKVAENWDEDGNPK